MTDVQIGRYEKTFDSLINPNLWKLCEALDVSLAQILGINLDEKGTRVDSSDGGNDEQLLEVIADLIGRNKILKKELEECKSGKTKSA